MVFWGVQGCPALEPEGDATGQGVECDVRHRILRNGCFWEQSACRTRLVSPAHGPGTVDGMADEEGTDRLAVVRWNIQRRRTLAGLSQAELAERMTERGLKFFPQTIQKIENGARTLRFDEAVVLAESLDIELWELLQKPAEEYLDDEVVRFYRAQKRIGEAAREALEAQERAAIIVDQAGDMGIDEVPAVLESHPLAGAHGVLAASVDPSRERNRLALLTPDGPVLSGEKGALMTEREPVNYGPSSPGSSSRLDELIERRRAGWGEGLGDGVDPEAS